MVLVSPELKHYDSPVDAHRRPRPTDHDEETAENEEEAMGEEDEVVEEKDRGRCQSSIRSTEEW